MRQRSSGRAVGHGLGPGHTAGNRQPPDGWEQPSWDRTQGDKFQQCTTFQGNILLVWAPSGWPEFLPPAELRL